MKKLIDLFLTFAKIGAFTFGGGYAMIPLIQKEAVENKKWISDDDVLEIIAIAESTPGPIAINSATYIGYRRAGVLGSAAATLGVVMPSFTIIYVISLFLDEFLKFELVAFAFRGIQAGVVYLILSAGLKMLRGLKKNPMSVSILCIVLLLMVGFSLFAIDFSAIVFILISAVVGLVVFGIDKAKAKREEGEK